MKETIRYLRHKLNNEPANPNLIYRLGKLAHPEATSILLDILKNTSAGTETRQYILVALRYTDDDRARDVLFDYFQNGYETSTEVINSIGVLGDKRAVPYLIRILRNETEMIRDYHTNLSLQFRATIALGNIGDVRAIPVLKDCLEEYHLTLRFALSDVKLQIPLCEYAHDALMQIGTPAATTTAAQWKAQYDERLSQEADDFLLRIRNNQAFTYLPGDLIHVKHHACKVLDGMSAAQLRNFPALTFDVLKEVAKQSERIPAVALQDVAEFIVDCLENNRPHLTLQEGFALLDVYDTPRSIPFALDTFANPDFDPQIHGNPLSILTRNRVQAAVPIIASKIQTDDVNERYLAALGAIGGHQAEKIITSYLYSEHSQIQRVAVYALADLAKESDSALETLSQLIDSYDYSISQQAIIRMDRVGSRATFLLINMLRNYDKWSSTRALSTLARIADKRAIPHIIDLLADGNYSYLHREAVNTLEKLGGELAYEVVNAWRGVP